MKKACNYLLLLVSIMLCISMILPAYAAPVIKDGFEITFTTDKDNYMPHEPIETTLVVKNTSGIALSDVTLDLQTPLGYNLAEGSNSTQQDSLLNNEELIRLTAVFNAIGSSVVPPKTGDDSHLALWLVGMILSAVALLVLKSKWRKQFVSMLLCIVMLVCIGMPVASATETTVRTIEVETTTMVSDRQVVIKATVSYTLPEQENENEISYSEPDPEHIVYDEANNIYYVNNQILLTAVEGTPRFLVEQLIKSLGGRVVGVIDITDDYQVEFGQAMTYAQLEELIVQFGTSSLVDTVLLHELMPTAFDYTPNDSKWKNEEWSAEFPEGINWGVEAIDALGAWEHRAGMQRVSVGIIDSMFDTSHEDLNFYKVWNNVNPSNSDLPYDDKSHGTHVAGTFTAMFNNNRGIAGVAPELLRYGFSMMDENTDSVLLDSDKTLSNLMKWKYALALLITNDCRVINVSMGSLDGFQRIHYNALDSFLTKFKRAGFDFLIVQSAGNDGVDASRNGIFVGCDNNRDRIIVVGSVGNNESHRDGLFGLLGERIFDGYHYSGDSTSCEGCFTSNWGSRVDIVAPGELIYSTVPGNKYEDSFYLGLAAWSGTSMATPHVAGVAALCYSVNPGLTAEQVKDIIISSASDSESTFVTRSGGSRNYPLVDANDAVDLAMTYTTSAPQIPTKGTVMGSVFKDNPHGDYLEDVTISVYMNSASGEDVFVTSTHTNAFDYTYALSLEPGTYSFSFYKEGYQQHIITNVKVFNNQVTYLDDVYMLEENDMGVVSGRITDAVTGYPLSGVQITFYPGWNNTMIIPALWEGRLVTCTTDSNGNYSVEIQQGAFTAVMTKVGYAPGSMNVTSRMAMAEPNTHNGALSPLQAADQYRIVLTWGENPSDLDSHLTGSLGNGNDMHVYYSSMASSANGNKWAALDVDDTTSYGPETITLYLPDSGSYRYAVHDYTNRNSDSSNAMGRSGAKVTVYKGSTVVATYPVPNMYGTVWNVFDLNDGEIQPLNTMSYVADPENVGSLVSTYASRRGITYHEDNKDYN